MKNIVRSLFVSSLVFASGLCFAAEPTKAELDDWFVYLKSVGAPATLDLCAPIVADKQAMSTATEQWLQANAEAIARGKVVAVSGLPEKWKSIEEFNTAMVADFKLKFAKLGDAEKASACEKWQESYQPPAAP
ncbi:hypothetical protein [Arenimonas oryziterrae]|uniref:Uncharacterized protein n=1 Tax=Arenimonas oryziterrae DSM 21050 = YC6267 TaxID=1121015 RepID=A0A091AYP9_9GAMM|nr:hypothetical protein [Arenimonas oryziterrae]KFN44551.1 hypothetical protein N789_00660 [Arenimonas oryziterrae DSM 21050 = YC6267]